jgi:hypothetical protein
MKIKKRSATLQIQNIHLGNGAITVKGCDQLGKFVCRLEINAAGLRAYSGKYGRKKLGDWYWHGLVQQLEK